MNYIEHVEITVYVQANFRGDVELYLTSPNSSSTETRLLRARLWDFSQAALDFRFMSVHQWGEPANGNWALRLVDTYDNG